MAFLNIVLRNFTLIDFLLFCKKIYGEPFLANDPNNHTMGSEFTPYYLILMSQGGAFNLKNFYSMIDRHSFVIVSRKKQSHKINNSRYSFERRKKTMISTIMPIIAILYILIST